MMQLMSVQERDKKPATKQSIMDGLPVIDATISLINSLDDSSCSICMGDFIVGDRLTSLPCGHHFHVSDNAAVSGEDECGGLMSWLQKCNECPMCRYKLEPEGNSSASVLDMGSPWMCPGCDRENPGDMVTGRNARCACGVNRNVVLLLDRSNHLDEIVTACADICRRITRCHNAPEVNQNEETAISHAIDLLAESSAVSTLESQNWEVKAHVTGLLRAILMKETQFPVILLCTNSRAVLRHIHKKLQNLHVCRFSFHTRPTSTLPVFQIYPPEYQMCFPLLDNTKEFISDNYHILSEIASLAAAHVSPELWDCVGAALLPGFEKSNWSLSEPFLLMGHGERDITVLTKCLGIDLGTIAVVENILVQVLMLEGGALPVKEEVKNIAIDAIFEIMKSAAQEEEGWECPGCDQPMSADLTKCSHCNVDRKVLRRSQAADVASIAEDLKSTYILTLNYRSFRNPSSELRSQTLDAITLLDDSEALHALEESGWELRSHFISMFHCIMNGGKTYPIFGLDKNSRALIRILHRQLANVHPFDAPYFDLDLSASTGITLPDELFKRGTYEQMVRQNIDLFDEIAGDIVYSSTDHRYDKNVVAPIQTLTSMGWKIANELDRIRRGDLREESELDSTLDRNSAGVVRVMLYLVNEREVGMGISNRRRTRGEPEKKKSWFQKLFGK
jgi:hypothetical protein